MTTPTPIKVPKTADIIFKKEAQAGAGMLDYGGHEGMEPGPSPMESGAPSSENVPASEGVGGQPMYPLQQIPLSNVVDRRYEIRKMSKNFNKIITLCEEKIHMLKKLLKSNGEDTEGFLEDPSVWDEKMWHDTTRRTDRLVRDVNEVLMTTRTGSAPEDEALPRRPDVSQMYLRNKERGGL